MKSRTLFTMTRWIIASLALQALSAAFYPGGWGPAVSSEFGLAVQASVQKIVGAIVVAVVTYQTYHGSAVDRAPVPSATAGIR